MYGANATTVTPGEMEDASRALDLLKGRGTLLEAARHYVAALDEKAASVPFIELWGEHEQSRDGTASPAYMREIRRIGRKIVGAFDGTLVCDITAADMEKALDNLFPTVASFNVAFRTIRPAWTLGLQRGYVRENIFDRFNQKRTKAKGEPDCLSVEQVRAVMDACSDHTKSEMLAKSYRIDCTDCKAAFAVLVFAGVRPDAEIRKLDWDAIDLENRTIKIGTGVAKGGRLRFIEIQDNLAAWLESVPQEQRTGRIVPPSWQVKYKAVRAAAGISHLQDVLRHTFASYRLAACGDIRELQNDMGHGSTEMILRHYRALVTKKDAGKFWRIGPDGEDLPAIREAVA